MSTLRSFACPQKARSAARVAARVTVAFAVPAVLVTLPLGACGTGVRPRTAATVCAADAVQSADTLVIAATATSAEPVPRLPASITDRLRRVASTGTPTCVLIVGPDDELQAVDITPRRPGGAVENGPDRARKVTVNVADLDGTVAGLARRAPGLDPVAALDAATRRHPTPGTVVLITSGVSTVDPADVRALGWDVDAVAVARDLTARHLLPDLTGWHVVLAGLGETQGNQPRLGPALRDRITAWWTAVCRAARAASCTVDRQLVSTEPPTSRNEVPVVPLPVVVTGPRRVVVPGVLFTVDSADVDPAADAALTDAVRRASPATAPSRWWVTPTRSPAPGPGTRSWPAAGPGRSRAAWSRWVCRASGWPPSGAAVPRGRTRPRNGRTRAGSRPTGTSRSPSPTADPRTRRRSAP